MLTQRHGVAAVTPDDFLVGLHSAFPNVFMTSIRSARQFRQSPSPSQSARSGKLVHEMESQ